MLPFAKFQFSKSRFSPPNRHLDAVTAINGSYFSVRPISFTWYLCLLPLCTGNMDLFVAKNQQQRRRWHHHDLLRSMACLGLSIVIWLASAYCLEMRGMAVHRYVWMASVLYFFANVNMLGSVLRSVRLSPPPPPESSSRTTTGDDDDDDGPGRGGSDENKKSN
jgi:Mannosyltransferase (PIG-M)